MQTRTALTAALIVVAAGMPLRADTGAQADIAIPPAPGLTDCVALDQALALALDASPDIQLANADRLRADADLRAARSVTRPQVSTFLRTQAGDANLTGAGLENSAGVRVSQRLFDFGTARLERDAAELALTARGFDVLSAENRVALETALAFIGMVEIAARIEVTRDRELFFEREQAAVAVALKLGGATRSDLAEVAARLEDASADRLELEFQRDRFAAALSRRIGQGTRPCAGSLETLITADDPAIVANVERALAENPELKSADLELDADQLRAERTRRNQLPAIDVVGIASFAQDNFDNNDFGFRQRIGIEVSIPLLTGGRLQSERQRSQSDILASSAEIQRQRLELAESVEVSARRIGSLRRQLQRRQMVVARQQDQFDAASAEFDEGLRTLPEWVEDRLELEAARLEELNTRFALYREEVQLRAQTNAISPQDVLTSPSPYGPTLTP